MKPSQILSRAKLPVLLLLAAWAASGWCPTAHPLPLLAQGPGDAPVSRKPAPDSAKRKTGDDPVEILPRSGGGGSIPVEPGEVHLLAVLQYLADASGTEVVYVGGKSVIGELVSVARRTDMADAAAVRAVLTRAGYEASEENFKGRKVLWVSRQLKATGRKGSIRWQGEEPRREEDPEAAEPAAGGGAALLFTRELQGRTTYLVLFETGSRIAAEEAYRVLQGLTPGAKKR